MLPETSAAHYTQQQGISALTGNAVARLWRRMGADFDSSWSEIRPKVLQVVRAGQLAAAQASVGYVANVLAETGQDGGDPAGVIDPAVFAITASDGRDLGTLLDEAPISAKVAVGDGIDVDTALAQSGRFLTMVTLTQVADASREYVAADMGVRPQVTGWVRMLNPPSCDALRHPRREVVPLEPGLPAPPALRLPAHPLAARTRPATSPPTPTPTSGPSPTASRTRLFGRSNARAIRDGGDIYRVVNVQQPRARGRRLPARRSEVRHPDPQSPSTRSSAPPAPARTRSACSPSTATSPGPQVVGGNLLGRNAEGYGALGKGGAAAEASKAVARARLEGREPLNRYTMSAAERRLYDAKARLDAAEKQGIWLRSIGANDADRYNRSTPVTEKQLAILRKAYATEVAKLTEKRDSRGRIVRAAAPASVQRLARLLGIS
jgi:hypothetical protein